jgi:hypothetical protein
LDICPPPPGTNANLLADIVQAIDRTSHIAACNDKSLANARQRVGNDLAGERLPLAFNGGHIDFLGGDERVN